MTPSSALPEFSVNLGIELSTQTPDLVVGHMVIKPAHSNRNGVMHGGAIMGFADSLGGTAAACNLNTDERTTTVESKTNFIRAIPIGDTITGTTVPLHKGRKTTLWQTTITRTDGKVAAIVVQTQMTLRRE